MNARASGPLIVALSVLVGGCAAKRIVFPNDAGTPLSGFDQIHAGVSEACRGVRTLTAELRLSGRAGGERLRGTVQAGFSRPASMRLDMSAGFGTIFALAANAKDTALLLSRERRVVRGARADEVLGALTGVTMGPADLLAILTGCVVASPRPTSGRLHANGLASIDLEGGATVYLRRSGQVWRLWAARRGDWQLEYPMWSSASLFPAQVRLRSEMPVVVDLTANVAQVETNTDLPESAFTLTVPPDVLPLTLDELRKSGPLREH